jgi:hypothetical protein
MDAERIVDFWMYKYNLTCLVDGDSWCLLEQNDWFVEKLTTTTLPPYTEKWYPDWNSECPSKETYFTVKGRGWD